MLSTLVALATICAQPPEAQSYLFRLNDAGKSGQALRYQPQPGDILMFDDHNEWSAKIYRYGGSGGPLHAGVVFRKPDGTLGTLEAGTNAVMKVFNFDLEPRLRQFDGTILIRTPKKALDDEQSRRLAEFAKAQQGKTYAVGRLALQAMPLRPRTTLLTPIFGRTVVDRDRWICSELVVASLAVAGVWSVDAYPANAMYPRDLCYDERFDLSPHFEPPAMWYPRPELEHVGKGVRVGRIDK